MSMEARHPHCSSERQRSREAFRLTNDAYVDLLGTAKVFELMRELREKQIVAMPEAVVVSANRMCLFSAVISLSKWSEAYDKYRGIMGLLEGEPKALKKSIEAKGIIDFRDQVAAHPRSHDLGRPFSNAEIEGWIQDRGGLGAFFSWIHSQDNHEPSVVSTLERIRDAIRREFELTDEDLSRV